MKSLFVAASLLVAASAAAKEAAQPIFVSASQSRVAEFLPSPPADGSAEQAAELAALHEIENKRSEADVAQARFDADNENFAPFINALGPNLKPESLPLTAALVARVINDESPNIGPAKAAFHRVHPYDADPTLKPVCHTKNKKDDSYPSGHATVGYLAALMLSELAPERRDALLERAAGYARSRLICGVHYPSDIKASESAAYAIHALMTANAQYNQEAAAARLELRQALGLH